MVHFADPPPTPPDWLNPILYTQYFFSFSLCVAGICHLAAHGVLSKLYTGIYVGMITMLSTYFEKWLLSKTSTTGVTYSKNQLRLCQIVLIVNLFLCCINVPIVSLFSVAYGDAFGQPFDENAAYCFFCYDHYFQGHQGANIPALICDGGLLLFGIITSVLLCASGSYYWTLILSDRLWFIDRKSYIPTSGHLL